MKAVALVFAASLTFQSGVAAFECPFGMEEKLLPIRWSAEQAPTGTSIRVGIRNTFDKAIKMVDAGVWFVDPLGRIVGDTGAEIDPDLKILPNGANISSMTVLGMERLRGAAFEDFTAHICTRAVLFEDGSKAEF